MFRTPSPLRKKVLDQADPTMYRCRLVDNELINNWNALIGLSASQVGLRRVVRPPGPGERVPQAALLAHPAPAAARRVHGLLLGELQRRRPHVARLLPAVLAALGARVTLLYARYVRGEGDLRRSRDELVRREQRGHVRVARHIEPLGDRRHVDARQRLRLQHLEPLRLVIAQAHRRRDVRHRPRLQRVVQLRVRPLRPHDGCAAQPPSDGLPQLAVAELHGVVELDVVRVHRRDDARPALRRVRRAGGHVHARLAHAEGGLAARRARLRRRGRRLRRRHPARSHRLVYGRGDGVVHAGRVRRQLGRSPGALGVAAAAALLMLAARVSAPELAQVREGREGGRMQQRGPLLRPAPQRALWEVHEESARRRL
eukprot:scaffold83946_cov36-Phaeocystis_antarctica.AAC.2